jgi:TatD DNase family protein
VTDTHCHPRDLADLLPAAEEERRSLGVSCAASSTTRAQFFYHEELAAQARADKAAPLFPCFAIHPQMPGPGETIAHYRDALDFAENRAKEGRIKAIGEAGFDLYHAGQGSGGQGSADFRRTEKLQDEIFSAQGEIALRRRLPLVIHSRRAMHKIFAQSSLLKKLPAVIFHSWPGTLGEGEALIRRGINVYFSFGAAILLNHKEAQRCCALFPVERLLSETDAPYQGLRGKGFSRWADLPAILRGMAALRREAGKPGGDAGDLEKTIDGNFFRVFGEVR